MIDAIPKPTVPWWERKEMEPPDLTTEQAFILKRMLRLAPQIRNNRQLKQILRKIDPTEREAFYELLKPHLSFKPTPFVIFKFDFNIRLSRS